MTLRREFQMSPDGNGDWIVRIDNTSEWGDYEMERWQALEVGGVPSLPYFGLISECDPAVLDMAIDTGFGSPDRPMFRVWTTNFVLFGTEYDGSTSVSWVCRSPNEEPLGLVP